MKKLMLLLLLAPFALCAQESMGYPMFTNIMLTPNMAEISELEAGLKEHNQKYHQDGAAGARVYWVMNGVNSDNYVWTMGPHTWGTMDEMEMGGDHFDHWNNSVLAHTTGTVTHTWRFYPDKSNFSEDFKLKYLNVFIADMARFKNELFMSVLDRVRAVYAAKMADVPYGIYFNTMATSDGMDFAWVDFFDKMTFLGEGDQFPAWFEEVHGSGTFAKFLEDWENSSVSETTEVWMYREDLSGLGADVAAAERQ